MTNYHLNSEQPLTTEQLAEVEEAKRHPIVFDEDCPESTSLSPKSIAPSKRRHIKVDNAYTISEALRIMDRNTTKYMIDEMKRSIIEKDRLIAEQDRLIAEKRQVVAELQAQLAALTKERMTTN